MTNLIPVLLLFTNAPTTFTNAPTTNYVTPSGKEIEVSRAIVSQNVTHYTNLNAVPIVVTVTNRQTNAMLLERFVLEEKWVPAPMPNIQRPPPLPQHR